LTDDPASYSGSGGYFVKVNSGATALEFTDLIGGNNTWSGTNTFGSGDFNAYNVLLTHAGSGYITRSAPPSGSDAGSLILLAASTTEAGYDGGNAFLAAGSGPNDNGDVFIYGGTNVGSSFGGVYLGQDAPASYIGNVYAETQSASDNSTKVATTAYVDNAVSSVSVSGTPLWPGVPIANDLSNQFSQTFDYPVTEYATMSAGNDSPHASLHVDGYFYVLTRQSPTRIFRYNADSLQDFTSLTFPSAGSRFDGAEQMVYSSVKDKIYVVVTVGVATGLAIVASLKVAVGVHE
jgi:hypothetical protein